MLGSYMDMRTCFCKVQKKGNVLKRSLIYVLQYTHVHLTVTRLLLLMKKGMGVSLTSRIQPQKLVRQYCTLVLRQTSRAV